MATLRVTDAELRDLLVKRLEILDDGGFEKARAMSVRLGVPLERALVERGRVPFGFLMEQLAQAWGLGFIDLKINDVRPEALGAVPEEYARRHALVPFTREDTQLHVAMWDPRDRRVIDEIERMSRLRVTPYLTPEGAIRRAQLLYKGDLREMLERSAAEETKTVAGAERRGTDGSAVDLVKRILEYAAVARASDIHVEPYELEALVRYRIDGVLHEVLSLPPALLPSLVARIKVLAGMRIDERRSPQDGRFKADLGALKSISASRRCRRTGERRS